MLKNYLKVAFRNLRRNKGFSFINISGLAIGIACFILIMLYVQYEFSFDKFHKRVDRVYRITTNDLAFYSDREDYSATTPGPLAPLLASEYPEVVHATRIRDARDKLIRYKNNRKEILDCHQPDFIAFPQLVSAMLCVMLTFSLDYFRPTYNP